MTLAEKVQSAIGRLTVDNMNLSCELVDLREKNKKLEAQLLELKKPDDTIE